MCVCAAVAQNWTGVGHLSWQSIRLRTRHNNTYVGSTPRCSKGPFSQNRLSAQTLLWCLCSPRVHLDTAASLSSLKTQTLPAIPLFRLKKILHTNFLQGANKAWHLLSKRDMAISTWLSLAPVTDDFVHHSNGKSLKQWSPECWCRINTQTMYLWWSLCTLYLHACQWELL